MHLGRFGYRAPRWLFEDPQGGGTPPKDDGGTPPAGGAGRTPADYEQEIENLKNEVIARRKENSDLKSWKDEREKSEMTEIDKAKKEAADATSQVAKLSQANKKLALQYHVGTVSRKLNIVDEDAAYRLLDHDKITWDEDKPTNVEDLLKELVGNKKYLVAQTQSENKVQDHKNGSNPPRDQKVKQLTRADLQRMTPEQINEAFEAGMLDEVHGRR